MARDRNNLMAGLFVLAGLALAFVVVVVLGDFSRWFTPMQQVQVQYTLRDGLLGLKQGASVTIGSDPAGSVVSITDVADEQDVIIGKRVTFEIPAKYRLYDNAIIELVAPPLGSGTALNIESFGREQPDKDEFQGRSWSYEPGDVIQGGIAGSPLTESMVKDLGIEDEQREDIREILGNVRAITRDLRAISGPIAAKPQQLPEILDNVQAVTASLRQDVPAITGDLRQIIADVSKHRKAWFSQVSEVLVKANDALGRINTVLMENSDDIRNTVALARQTMAAAKDISQTARDQTMVKVNATLDDARLAVADLKQVIATVNRLVDVQRPVLEQTLANMRLTSDQLKLTAIEVRRSPWRLLYSPSDRELETNNVYDAARSFALAAGALDTSTQSLRVLVENHGESLAAADPDLKLMLDNLHQTFEKFIIAEKRFWHAVEAPAGKD